MNSITSWAMSLDYRSNGKHLSTVRNTLNYFLDGFKFHSIDKKNKTLMFKEGKYLLKLEDLSDGYQSMTAWIGDLLYRVMEAFINYKDPLKARGVLLIDEIDLHLHPKWQRKLLDFVAARLPNFQLIATTHSPLTAQQADEHELYALCKDERKRVYLIPFVGSPKDLLINQLLMSPVFGLKSDEAYSIEKDKEEYLQLKAIKAKTPQQRKRFLILSNELKERPNSVRINSMLTPTDRKLIMQLKSALKK